MKRQPAPKSARIPSQTLPARGKPKRISAEKSCRGFANPCPRKMLRKTESAFALERFPHFCFSRSSVLRTEALQRAGNAGVLC
ncbi:MAG: hypothetical protein A2915_01040 [Candidatus Yanofskybacteria bacterium RIFCSPLOWO2_01_FULL_41_34]|nr:MAG: hypothetical protein A2915_01040 [Candidatus Yanofskybacteria bacterium RIFCSPLOWO2_01_FULL_41_34]